MGPGDDTRLTTRRAGDDMGDEASSGEEGGSGEMINFEEEAAAAAGIGIW